MSEENDKWLNHKIKNIEIVQQVEYMHCDIKDLERKFDSLHFVDKWAYILHDKDEGVEPHYHILLSFNNSYTVKRIRNETGFPTNCLETIKTNFANALSYLIHDTPTAVNKHRYDEDSIVANYDIKQELREYRKKSNINQKKQLLLIQLKNGIISKNQIDKYFIEHDIPDEFRIKWDREIKIACNICSELNNNDRNMDVIFISGKSGTGKTTFAKDLAEKMDKELYISSGNINDLFSGYSGERIVCIDDIPKNGLTFDKALKLLDNNTCSLYESRYHDKNISNIEIMIVTSTYDIDEIFSYGEDFEQKQIHRRIKTFLVAEKETIDVYRYEEQSDEYVYENTIINPLYEYIKNHKSNEESINVVKFLSDKYKIENERPIN